MAKKSAVMREKELAVSPRAKKSSKADKEIVVALATLRELKPVTAQAAKVITLLESWLKDESGYDEQTWPELKKSLDRERIRTDSRRLFDG